MATSATTLTTSRWASVAHGISLPASMPMASGAQPVTARPSALAIGSISRSDVRDVSECATWMPQNEVQPRSWARVTALETTQAGVLLMPTARTFPEATRSSSARTVSSIGVRWSHAWTQSRST